MFGASGLIPLLRETYDVNLRVWYEENEGEGEGKRMSRPCIFSCFGRLYDTVCIPWIAQNPAP
jgi:hypothetical protein